LTDVFTSLEQQLGLASEDRRLVQRKQRLLKAVAAAGKTVVFDAVGWTTPKLSSFLGCVSERVPIWMSTRSAHPWDIGHFWPFLWRFERIEIHPFHLAETRALVGATVRAGRVPAAVLDAVERLHQLAAGSPKVLCELLEGLATGRYDPHKVFDLTLLNLDRRIHQLAPAFSFDKTNVTPAKNVSAPGT